MAFAMATVVRTVAATAAKAGAKALIAADGAISDGWIGGGCARAAVLKAAIVRADGRPAAIGQRAAGRRADQPRSASRRCPRRGAVRPQRLPRARAPWISLSSRFAPPASCDPRRLPVAVALADLAARMGFFVSVAAHRDDHGEICRRGPDDRRLRSARRHASGGVYRHCDAGKRRYRGADGGNGGGCAVCGLCRLPQESRHAEGPARRDGRGRRAAGGPARSGGGSTWARSRRTRSLFRSLPR